MDKREVLKLLQDQSVSLISENDALTDIIASPLLDLAQWGATKVNLMRFKRFADVISEQIKRGDELDDRDRKKFYYWIVDDPKAGEFFHDFIRNSLQNNSKYIQVALGLIFANAYKNTNISYQESKLLRGLNAIDDYEIALLLDYLSEYREDLLQEGNMLVLFKKYLPKLSQKHFVSEDQIEKDLKAVFELLIIRGLLPNRLMISAEKGLQVSAVSETFLLAIMWLRKANQFVDYP